MKPVSPKVILALNYLIFLFFGMFMGGIGTVFNELALQTNSTLTAVGGIITFLFLGSLLAQIVAGPLTDRYGHRNILVGALVILGLGIIGFTFAHSLPVMLALVFVTGIGQGGVDIGANLVVSDAAPGKNTGALNLLHFFFGVGAFIGPALIGFAIASTGSGLLMHCLTAGALVLLGITFFFLLRESSGTAQALGPDGEKGSGFRIYFSPILWLFGVLMVVYVGIEFGLGSWITNYMTITTSVALEYGALATSAFWGALALGRLAGAAASRKDVMHMDDGDCPNRSLAGAIGMVLSRGSIWPRVICIALISFFFGTVYPTTLAYTISGFPMNREKRWGSWWRWAISAGSSCRGWQASCWSILPGWRMAGLSLFSVLVMLAILFLLRRRLNSRRSINAGHYPQFRHFPRCDR